MLNVVATVVAVVVSLPSQCGMTGRDAGREFLTSGTAISAPPFPLAASWSSSFSALARTGGVGELLAQPTADTPEGVLVGSGIVWVAIALGS